MAAQITARGNRMRFLNLQLLLGLGVVFFNLLQAQDLKGLVQSEAGIPISGATLSVNGEMLSETDAHGVFHIPREYGLPLRLTIRHPEYETKTRLFSKSGQLFVLHSISEIETLGQIVIVAPTEAKNNLIVPTSQLNSNTIEQQNPISLVDAMNTIPGVYVQSGAINTNRITMRGVGARTLYGTNKIKAYFNGIPITNGIGETVLDIYDVEDLQAVEIIKGPKATLYGTNLGGALILRSKSAPFQGLNVQNKTTLGSFGLFKNSFSTAVSDTHFSIHLNYNHMEMDGFRENSSYQINSYNLIGSFRIDDATTLSAVVNYANNFAQLPSSIGKTDFLESPSKAAATWRDAKGYKTDRQILTGIHLKHKFSGAFENGTSVFYSYSDHYEPRPFNVLDEITKGVGLRSVFTNTFNFLGRTAIWNFGTELFQDNYHWKTIENLYQSNSGNGTLEGGLLSKNNEKRHYLNLFSDLIFSVSDKVSFQLGMNFNTTAYDFKDVFNPESTNTSASRNFKPIVAPNLNLSYQVTPNQQFFANFSYGFNFPSLEEALTPEGVVNPEISPEKGYNYEVGTEMYLLKRRWHLLASYYLLDIKDLLVAQRVGDDQYIGRNAGRTLHKGLELMTSYKLPITKGFYLTPYLNASFNWHKFKDFVDGGLDYSGHDLTGSPNVMLAMGLGVNLEQFALYLNHAYVGEMPMNDANSLYSDAYHLLNLKADYTVQLFEAFDVKINFGINNVTDTHYASSILINATGFGASEPRYYYPGNPRNYYGGVALHYRL